MSVLVNLPSAAGLAVLLGLTWLLRGARAAVRWCAWTGVGVIISGLAAGSVLAAGAGTVITGSACWTLRSLRRSGEPGRSPARSK